MELELAASYWVLEQMPGERLPKIAEDAIRASFRSESLYELAGEIATTVRDTADLFERVLRENGIPKLDKNDAAFFIADYFANEIVNSSIPPYDGAKKIVQDVCNQLEHTPPELIGFVGLEDEYLDFSDTTRKEYYGEKYCEAERQRIEKEIVRVAQSLLGRAT